MNPDEMAESKPAEAQDLPRNMTDQSHKAVDSADAMDDEEEARLEGAGKHDILHLFRATRQNNFARLRRILKYLLCAHGYRGSNATKKLNLGFWIDVSSQIGKAKTKYVGNVYDRLEDFIFNASGLLSSEVGLVVKLAVALMRDDNDRAGALARALEALECSPEVLECSSEVLEARENMPFWKHRKIKKFNLAWLAMMAGNLDVLEILRKKGFKMPWGEEADSLEFDIDLPLLQAFYHKNLKTGLSQTMEDRGFVDPSNLDVKFVKIFAAVALGADGVLEEQLKTLTTSQKKSLSGVAMPMGWTKGGYDDERLCRDIRWEDEGFFNTKTIYMVALEARNLDALKLLVQHRVMPYDPCLLADKDKWMQPFDQLRPLCFFFYRFIRDQDVFDIMLKEEQIRSFVSPCLLFYAAHSLDWELVDKINAYCRPKEYNERDLLSDHIEGHPPAFKLLLDRSTCEDKDLVLTRVKTICVPFAKTPVMNGDIPSGGQEDPKIEVGTSQLCDDEFARRLDDWKRKGELTCIQIAKAISFGVSFPKFRLMKSKLFPGGAPLQASETNALFSAAISRAMTQHDETFLSQFLAYEDMKVAMMKRLSRYIEPFPAMFPDDGLFHICVPPAFLDCDYIHPFYYAMLQKLLAWCQDNKDVWMSSLVNWIKGRQDETYPGLWSDQSTQEEVWRVCSFIKEHDQELFRSQNRIGMNLLMYAADLEGCEMELLPKLVETGLFDINATAQVLDRTVKFELQHLDGISVSAKKLRNTQLKSNHTIPLKKVRLVRDEARGQDGSNKCTFKGQDKYVSKNLVRIKEPDEALRRIMVTATRTTERRLQKTPKTATKQLESVAEEMDEMPLVDDNSLVPGDAMILQSGSGGSGGSQINKRIPPPGFEYDIGTTISEKVDKMFEGAPDYPIHQHGFQRKRKAPQKPTDDRPEEQQSPESPGKTSILVMPETIKPEHFDSQSLKTDTISSGFKTKKNKYKFASNTSTKVFDTESSVAELLSPNYCIGTNALLLSIKAKQRQNVEYLLRIPDIDVYHKDASKCSALSLIIKNFSDNDDLERLVKLVLSKMDKKFFKQDKDPDGKTAREIAKELGLDNTVKVMDTFDFTILHKETDKGFLDVDGYLFKRKGEMTKKKEQKWCCTKCNMGIKSVQVQERVFKLLGKPGKHDLKKHEA